MGYGPFKSKREYDRALSDWNLKAKSINEKNFANFKSDIYNAVADVFFDYYQKGCRYSKQDVDKALEKFFESPDPFDFADMIQNEDDFEDKNYFSWDEKKLSPSEQRIKEREKYYKDMKKIFH